MLGGEDTIITESDTLFSLEGECQTREHIALRKKRRWSEKVGNSVKKQSEVCGGVYSAEVFLWVDLELTFVQLYETCMNSIFIINKAICIAIKLFQSSYNYK